MILEFKKIRNNLQNLQYKLHSLISAHLHFANLCALLKT